MTGPPALHPDLLSRLSGCALPGYDRRAATAGVVHVGLGAFARAHVARYCDDLLALGDAHAAIAGASLVSGATARALAPQDGLYTLIETDGRDPRLRVVGSVTRSAEGPEATVDALAEPSTAAVTLTITEKGYHHDPARGGLAVDDPAVAHDLAHPGAPRTAPGVLVAGLRRRREQGGAGLAVVSCDNLVGNGAVTAAVVTDLAAALDPDLAGWIADHVAFPSTVVDRIVPATTDADRRLVVDRLGVRDAAPVLAEPYCSWVVEAAPGLPRWDRVGATFVDDVAPWQRRKLRLVNGLHSALAYLGALAGHATVDAAVGDPALAGFVRVLATDEILPTLEPPPAAPRSPLAAPPTPGTSRPRWRGSPTRPSAIGPGRWRPTARRSCARAWSARSPTAGRPARRSTVSPWSWRPGWPGSPTARGAATASTTRSRRC